jgi:RimJ/RimL family protein N-acetyltransferase
MGWVEFPNGLGWDEARMREWLDRVLDNPDRHHFMVSAEEVGFCGEAYYSADPASGLASLDIKFRPEAQGRGLATDALRTLIRHVFETRADVETVYTRPSERNTPAHNLYRRCGLAPAPRPAHLPPEGMFWALSRATWESL